MAELPNVIALPVEEAGSVLSGAGWSRVEIIETRAPRMRKNGTGRQPEPAGALLVVRQQLLPAGVVRLTVAEHPGEPGRAGDDVPRDGEA